MGTLVFLYTFFSVIFFPSHDRISIYTSVSVQIIEIFIIKNIGYGFIFILQSQKSLNIVLNEFSCWWFCVLWISFCFHQQCNKVKTVCLRSYKKFNLKGFLCFFKVLFI